MIGILPQISGLKNRKSALSDGVKTRQRRRLSRISGVLIALILLLFSWGTVQAQSPNADLAFDMEDMDFILNQIKFSEEHARRALLPPVNFAAPRAACDDLLDILPNASVQWGLRTVDGSCNNLIPGQTQFGQADLEFPTGLERVYRDAQTLTFPLAPNDVVGAQTSYIQGDGKTVQDSTPRLISQMIVNQSVANPAAVFAAGENADSSNVGPDITGIDQFMIPNVAPDEGLSAPTNAFITFFGQFFDHGLDLVNKGGNGLVFTPLQPDDPLFDPTPGAPNFMLLTRATLDAGPDGIIGNDDDVSKPINATTPHVDQQQTYGSHASAQILLRHYEIRNGSLQSNGRLLNGFGDDQILDNADDGGLATWDSVQEQALKKLGIILDDFDGNNIPMFAADPYGKFIPGPLRGLPQLVTAGGLLVEGNRTTPVDASQALRVNHSFFLDVAHSANPNGQTGPLLPDGDTEINPRTDSISGQTVRGIRAAGPAGTYDDELLGVHFSCGDGRCNENIALTTIHHIFHREHNRLTNVAKRVILDTGDLTRLNEWLDTPMAVFPTWGGLPFLISDASLANQAATQTAINALNLDWNGERIFQAARFGTEMQYNRIVFDEFGPTLAGLKDVFEGFHTNVDPTITTEFSQSVYRFGHSMLTNTVDRFDTDFNTILDTPSGDASQLQLLEAFLNPLSFYDYDDVSGTSRLNPEVAAGAVVRGITRTRSNEIDEFVTGALQNNLLGLPLDLAAINIARGRDTGVPPLNTARRMFFESTLDTRLMPYAHWIDYTDNLRHEPTIVNFIAAYGTHPTLAGTDGIVGNADDPISTYVGRRAAACAIVGARTLDPVAYCEDHGFGTPPETPPDAMGFLLSRGVWASDENGRTITGLDDVDFWNGGLAEERMPFGGYLGSTHNFVFENQLESLQNGDRFYYVGRTANIHLFSELESNSFTALVMRNTDLGEPGAGSLPLNIFSVPNHILEVDQRQQFNAAGDGTTADPMGDAELIPLVIRDSGLLSTNITVSDSTRVVQYTGGDHVTIGGTAGSDTIIGGIGDDAIIGGDGNDRLEGGDGADLIEGGAGDDIITDLSGPDVIEGGDGNDAIFSGNEEDVIFGDAGNDFIINPSELGEIFGGLDNDYILDGIHLGHVRGGAGDDWMENLGGGEDLFQGDNGAAAELGEPPVKGNDVFIAHAGNNDADMENGDDIIVDGPGIERAEGQLGFDWISFQNDRFGVNIDLDLTIFLRPQLPPSNDTVLNRYDRIEGISGSPLSDILRGTANPGGTDNGNELVNFSLIEGLDNIVPLDQRRDLDPDPLTGEAQFGWTGGEIVLGGAGSDMLVGEGGNDIIDGDASLKVAIRTPNPAIRMGPLGQALLAAKAEANGTGSQAVLDADASGAFTESKMAAEAAVAAADAAVLIANAAVAAEEAAQAGLSNLTITDAIGNLIQAAVLNPVPEALSIKAAWQDFLNSCSAALNDLGFDVGATSASTAAETLAAQAAAVAANVTLTQVNLDADAQASAALVIPAQVDLATAQANMDAADEFILVAGMQDVMDAVYGGYINPGELAISRVIGDDDPTDADTDIVVYSGVQASYTIVTLANGFTEITDLTGIDGRDLVRNIERLQFADQTIVLDIVAPINSVALGQPTISGTASVNEILNASIAGVTDSDNVTSGGAVTSMVDWVWQVELDPGSNVFVPIERDNGNGDVFEVRDENIALTTAEDNLRVRVMGVFQDEETVFETVFSAPVLVSGVAIVPAMAVALTETAGTTAGSFNYTALASGGTPPYEYRFLLRSPGGGFVVQQNWSQSPVWTWNTAGLAGGTYRIRVHARSQGSQGVTPWDVVNTVTHTIVPPPATAVSLTETVGTVVGTFDYTAAASGGTPPYEYRFLLRSPSGGFVVQQNWSQNPVWTWDTLGLAGGTYRIRVHARSQGSQGVTPWDVVNTVTHTIVPPPATAVSLTETVGTTAGTFDYTAAASGGTPPYEYRFLLRSPGGGFIVQQNWSQNPVWTWDTVGLAAGAYSIRVHARSQGSQGATPWDVVNTVVHVIP